VQTCKYIHVEAFQGANSSKQHEQHLGIKVAWGVRGVPSSQRRLTLLDSPHRSLTRAAQGRPGFELSAPRQAPSVLRD